MDGIVVGVDGSEPSQEALRWAIGEARLRGCVVHAIYVWAYAHAAAPGFTPPPMLAFDDLRRSAEGLLDAVVADALEGAEDVEVRRVAVEGTAAATLVQASEDAELLVLGARGHGGFAGLLLGSVSDQCVHHARCPVVVVRSSD